MQCRRPDVARESPQSRHAADGSDREDEIPEFGPVFESAALAEKKDRLRRNRAEQIHHRGGRGAATVRIKMKNLLNGATIGAFGGRGMGQLLGNDATQFRRMRETPMAAAALGPSFGSSTWLCCLSDFAVMHKKATMAVSSPGLVSMALGEKVAAENKCGTCHGADYKGKGDVPRLAGQHSLYMIRQLKDMQTGARKDKNVAAMKAIVAKWGMTDAVVFLK